MLLLELTLWEIVLLELVLQAVEAVQELDCFFHVRCVVFVHFGHLAISAEDGEVDLD